MTMKLSLLMLLAAMAFGIILYATESPTALGLVDAATTVYDCAAGRYPLLCDSSFPSRLARIIAGEFQGPYTETYEEVVARLTSAQASLGGRVAIVTGASSGLGEECARMLLKYGCHVVLAVRTPEKGRAALQKMQAPGLGGKGTVIQLDTSDLDSVKAFVKEFTELNLPLHYLVMNAGVGGMAVREQSKQGHELTFATNNLGHFLLGRLLEPALLEAGTVADPARIVYVTSEAQHLFANAGGGSAVENLRQKIPPSPREFHGLLLYAQSKALGVLTAMEHQRRLGAASRAIAVSVHPGLVPTEMFAKVGGAGLDALFFGPLCAPLHKSLQQGVSTYAHALLSPDVVAEVRAGGSNLYAKNALAAQNPALLEPGVAQEAWRLSEDLVAPWL